MRAFKGTAPTATTAIQNVELEGNKMKPLSVEEIAIRMATERAVQAAGGGRQVALALGRDEPTVSRLQNTSNEQRAADNRAYLKASEIVTLDKLAGASILLEAICALEGRELAPVAEAGIADEGMSAHSAALLKEFAEAIADMAVALRKGMSPTLAKHLYDSLQDVINRAKDAQAECFRTICENKPSQVLKAVRQ